MSFNYQDQRFIPSESYSRQLDRRVAMDEYPYGYDGNPPEAGYQNEQMVKHYKNPVEKRQKAV